MHPKLGITYGVRLKRVLPVDVAVQKTDGSHTTSSLIGTHQNMSEHAKTCCLHASMSEEIEILLAAKSFHEILGDLLDTLDDEWISQSRGSICPGGKIDLASLGQSVFFKQFWYALC
jgi:hypothetical protein